MLSFVIIVCGGNMYVITTSCSKLTWLEELVLYLEYVFGHSISRWSDYEKEYDLHENSCRCVLWSKLTIVVSARKRWPMYATHKRISYFLKINWMMK